MAKPVKRQAVVRSVRIRRYCAPSRACHPERNEESRRSSAGMTNEAEGSPFAGDLRWKENSLKGMCYERGSTFAREVLLFLPTKCNP